ncbi:hypothetical protein H0H93_014041 [Arthromyces matolae]|nr:hypothetical protein H0H93_014041 [Arthromyces matolae]
MSMRTFTVFQDSPSTTDIAKPKMSTTNPVALISKQLNVNNATTLTGTDDKENFHPLTGERAGPSTTNGKKRKTSVLATKIHAPLSSKKQKESTDSTTTATDMKKRKSSGTSAKPLKAAGGKKDTKTSSSRKVTKKPSRRVSPMPKLDEEAEADRVRERISQAEIDARCYELTVKPLADLSQAYEAVTPLELITPSINDDELKFRSELSAEPEIRDYFSSPPQSSALLSKTDGALDCRTFSTPERKQIYAAFTFTSPSPTSERFNKATLADRDTVVPRIELELV